MRRVPTVGQVQPVFVKGLVEAVPADAVGVPRTPVTAIRGVVTVSGGSCDHCISADAGHQLLAPPPGSAGKRHERELVVVLQQDRDVPTPDAGEHLCHQRGD